MINKINGYAIKLIRSKSSESSKGVHNSDISISIIKEMVESGELDLDDVRVVLNVTQTPKFLTPATSFYICKEIGITSMNLFQYDIKLGASGFGTGLMVALEGMEKFGEAGKALVIFGDNEILIGNTRYNVSNVFVVGKEEKSEMYFANTSCSMDFGKMLRITKEDELVCDDVAVRSFVENNQQHIVDEIMECNSELRNVDAIDNYERIANGVDYAADVARMVASDFSNKKLISSVGSGLSGSVVAWC